MKVSFECMEWLLGVIFGIVKALPRGRQFGITVLLSTNPFKTTRKVLCPPRLKSGMGL